MKLYSWNVNGVRAVVRKGALQEFLSQHQPDVLCLGETKAKQGQAEIDLPDYTEFWNAAEKAGYSGTAIFTRTEPIQVVNDIPADIADKFELDADEFGSPNREGRVIAAEFERIWLVNVYVPNSKRDLTRLDLRYRYWEPAFLAYLKRLEQQKPVVFCGDLNVAHAEIDLANPKANRRTHGFTDEERERFQDILDAGFFDTFRQFHPEQTGAYTWWQQFGSARERNVGWRIDYFVASSALKPDIVSADIWPNVLGSDHCPISLELTD